MTTDAIAKTEIAKTEEPFDPEDYKKFLDILKKHRKNFELPEFEHNWAIGFFHDYITYGDHTSYSKLEYHFATLLTLVSMLIGRRVLLQIGTIKAYCNIFALLVGLTTISGKSSACRVGKDEFSPIVNHTEPLNTSQNVKIMDGTHSTAAFVQEMSDEWNQLWYYDDCGSFFEDAIGWNASILAELCRAYDGSEISRNLSSRGKDGQKHKWACPEPFLSLLFNCTTAHIEQYATSRMYSSGFFPRMMFFWGEGGEPRVNQDVSPADKKILERVKSKLIEMRDDLQDIPQEGLKFGVSKEIEEWKLKNMLDHLDPEDEPIRIAYGRAFLHAYKIAVIFALSDIGFREYAIDHRNDDGLIKIPASFAMAAIKIVDLYLIPRMIRVEQLSHGIDLKNHQVLVKQALLHYRGAATKKQLYAQTHLNKTEMTTALNALLDAEMILMEERKTSATSNKKTLFVVLKNEKGR